ncbi:hypothetical protein Hanom_Chr06g00532121 [Helianthus anomalus]
MATYTIFCDQMLGNSHTRNYKISCSFTLTFVTPSLLSLFLCDRTITNVMENICDQRLNDSHT